MIVATVLAKLEADVDHMVRNVRKAEQAHDNMAKSVDRNGKAIDQSSKRVESSIGGIGKAIDKIHRTAEKSFGGVANAAEKAGVKVSKEMVKSAKYGDKMTDAGRKAEKSLDQVAGKAGTTGSRIESAMNKARREVDRLGGAGGPGSGGIPGITNNLKNAETQAVATGGALSGMAGNALKIAGAIGLMNFFSEAIGGLGNAVIGYNQDIEQAMIGMTTMLGSASKAQKFMADMQNFAAKTPFSFQGLVSATQQLMAFGFASKDVIPDLTAVGDATAAMGGSMDDMGSRVIRALGQISAKGKVAGQEMMQLAESGIPAWQYLADAIGVDVPSAMKISEKQGIASAVAINAITSGMERDFGGMMAAQSKTMMGAWSTVLDYLQMNFAKATKPLYDNVKDGILKAADWLGSPAATEFASKWTKTITSDFNALKTMVAPAVMASVKLLEDLIRAGVKVGSHLNGMFMAIGVVIVGAFKGLESVIRILDKMVSFIDQNETAAKALAIAIALVVSHMAASKVIGFWSQFTEGAGNAMTGLKGFIRTSGESRSALMKMKTALQEAEAAGNAMTMIGQAKIARLKDGIAEATSVSVGFGQGIKNAGANMMEAFGGPETIIATAAIGLIAFKLMQAAQKAAEFEQRVKAMEDRAKAALESMKGKEGNRKFTTEAKYRLIVDTVFSDDYKKLPTILKGMKADVKDIVPFVQQNRSEIVALDKAFDRWHVGQAYKGRDLIKVFTSMNGHMETMADLEAEMNKQGKGSPFTYAVKEMDKALRKSGSSMREFISSDFGNWLVRSAASGKLNNQQLNVLIDNMGDISKTYGTAVDKANDWEKQLRLAAQAAANADKSNKKLGKSFVDIFSTLKEADQKTLNETVKDFDKSVEDITNTWNNMDVKSLDEQIGLNEFEKNMDEKLVYIAKWSENMQFLLAHGLDPAVFDTFMQGGPQEFGKMVNQLVHSPERIAGLNDRFRKEMDISNAVADMKHSMDLMTVLVSPGSTFMDAMQWAVDNGVDLMDVLAKAPENVRKAWSVKLLSASNGLKTFLKDAKESTPVDLSKKIKMDPKQLQMTLVSKFDSVLATMPSLDVAFGADPKSAKDTLDEFVKKVMSAKPGVDVKVKVNGQDQIASVEQVTAIKSLIDFVDKAAPSLHIKADPKTAATKLNWFLGQIDASQGTLSILADPFKGMKELKSFQATVDKTTGVLTIDGTPIPADSKLNDLKKRIDESTGTVTLDANEQDALTAIGNVSNAIKGIPFVGSIMAQALKSLGAGASPGMKNAERMDAHANGAVVDYYANGGFAGAENHVAQIAPAGAMRMWAEPETGGEAYIPLSPSKRSRSMDILDAVARRFGKMVVDTGPLHGYANGAVVDVNAVASTVVGPSNRVLKILKDWTSQNPAGATGLNPAFLAQYNAYNASLGNIIKITSGWRSYADQVRLYAEKGAYSSSHAGAARPGTSMHEKGLAIDHSPASNESMRRLASTFGLRYPMGNEPWHVQPVWAANGGIMDSMVRMATYDQGGVLWPGYTLAYNGTGMPEYVHKGGEGTTIGGDTYNINGDLDKRILALLKRQQENRDKKLVRTLRKK